MIQIVTVIVAIAGIAVAQPPPGALDQFGPAGRAGLLRNPLAPSGLAVTLRSINENVGDGNYRYEYETSDGTRVEQTGILRGPDPLNPEGVQAVQGSYSYISPEGITITVNYIADENGFQPIGDHIPGNNLRLRATGGALPALGRPGPGPVSPVAAALAAQRLNRPSPTVDPELAAIAAANGAPVTPAPGVPAYDPIRNPYNRVGLNDPYNNNNNRINPYANNPYAFGGGLGDYRRPGAAGQNPYLAYNRGLGISGR